jgi:hypothetical protein
MLGKNELDKAQVAIDALVEKDGAKADNHYLKYKVYKAINESEQFKKLIPNALETSWAGLKKFASLDKNFTAMIKENILNIAEPFDVIRRKFINEGSTNLDAKNWDASYAAFKNSLDVYKVFLDQKWTTITLDTLITFYTGYAAMNAKKMEDTELYFKKLTDANANGTDIQIAYGWLANYYIDTKKENAKGKEIAEKGLKFYPNDEYLNDMVAKAIAGSGDMNAIFANHEVNINKPNAPYAEFLKYAADLFDYLYNDSTMKKDFAEKQKKFEDVMGKGLTMKPASAEGNYLMGFHHANIAVDLDKQVKTFKNKKAPAELEETKIWQPVYTEVKGPILNQMKRKIIRQRLKT